MAANSVKMREIGMIGPGVSDPPQGSKLTVAGRDVNAGGNRCGGGK
jgi:hypothetical protein